MKNFEKTTFFILERAESEESDCLFCQIMI